EHLPAVGDTDADQAPGPAGPEGLPEPEPPEEASPETVEASEPEPAEEAAPETAEGPAAAGPAASLPRRRSGGNPIKRAAEEIPVVPGTSRSRDPVPGVDAGPEFQPAVVSAPT